MNNITLAIPYYKNPKTLEYQINIWNKYPKEVEIILVDDGSPIGFKAEDVIKNNQPTGNFKLYRILADMPWNMSQARNIGMYNATSKWAMWLDIDHVISLETIKLMLEYNFNDNMVYSFNRINHFSRVSENPHKETHLMSLQMFINLGGFDESFAGHYAFSERDFMLRLKSQYKIDRLPFNIERISTTNILDCKTASGFIRNEGRDNNAYDEIQQWKLTNQIGTERFKLPWKRII